MKKILILAIAIVSLSQMVYSAEWEKYTNGLYVDTTSITKDKDSVSGWITQFNFGQYKKVNNKNVVYAVEYITANCTDKKFAVHNVAYYGKRDKQIQSYNWEGLKYIQEHSPTRMESPSSMLYVPINNEVILC